MTAKLTAWECRRPALSKPGVLRLTIELDAEAAEDVLNDLDARKTEGDGTAIKALLADLHWHLVDAKRGTR